MASEIASLLWPYMAACPTNKAGTMPKAKRSKISELANDPQADCGALVVAEVPECGENDVDDVELAASLTGRQRGKLNLPSNAARIRIDDVSYMAQPAEKRKEIAKREWERLAYVLLGRANAYAQHITKKDFGRLMQLATTAGIAFDKYMPKEDRAMQGNLIVNMFGSLDSGRLGGVVGTTVIDSTAIEVEQQKGLLSGTPPAIANKVPGQDEG